MPHVVPLDGPDATILAAIRDLYQQIKDLGNNNLAAPYSLVIGLGGLTDQGPAALQAGVTVTGGTANLNAGASVTGGETVDTLTVTGSTTLHATTVASGGLAVTGGLTPDTVSASGQVSGTNGVFSGQVQSNGSPFKSQPSFAYHVATSYQGAWIDGATYQLGISASSEMVKTSLTPMTADDARKLLNMTPYWGRYVWDAPDSPLKVFFLAADVQAAGFGPDVACISGEPIEMLMPDGSPVLDTNGQPCVVPPGEAYSINYSQLVVPLVAAWHDGAAQMQAMQATVQAQASQIAALESRLTAAGIA